VQDNKLSPELKLDSPGSLFLMNYFIWFFLLHQFTHLVFKNRLFNKERQNTNSYQWNSHGLLRNCSETSFFLLLPNFTNHCHQFLLFTFSQFLFYDYSMSLGIFYEFVRPNYCDFRPKRSVKSVLKIGILKLVWNHILFVWNTKLWNLIPISLPTGMDFIYGIVRVFWQKVEDIFSLRGSILMKDSFLETLLVVDYMIKVSVQNFWNFTAKFGLKAEICW
jgi:hypothetical protein